MAANLGNASAQYNIGNMYRVGAGVPQNNVIAHMWFNIAAANGVEEGANNRETIAKLMTAEDVSKSQAMARKCMESNYKECGY